MMVKFAAADVAVPVCTVTEARPEAVSNPAGRTALIEVALEEFRVRAVGLPPGGVKRTTGVPPALRFVPLMMNGLIVAAFCAAVFGLRLVMAGSITVTVPELETAPPATIWTVAAPALASCAEVTVNDAMPAVTAVNGKVVVGPGEGEIHRATPV